MKTQSAIGEKHGKITVIENLPFEPNSKRRIIGKCECGTVRSFDLNAIRTGSAKSCGCSHPRQNAVTHGLTKHPLYSVWKGIKKRCYNKKDKFYHIYGGAGIKICNEWLDDFKKFYNWALQNGYKKSLQIDRFPDKKGNYEPSNCRWATSLQNNHNRTSSVMLNYNGNLTHLSDLVSISPVTRKGILYRISRLGWSIEKSVDTPRRK